MVNDVPETICVGAETVAVDPFPFAPVIEAPHVYKAPVDEIATAFEMPPVIKVNEVPLAICTGDDLLTVPAPPPN